MTPPPRGIWARIHPRTAARLREHGTQVVFRHGESIIVQGESSTDVFVVRHGFALVVRDSPGGTRLVLAVRGPGDLVGEHAGWSTRVRSATVVANGPLSALRLTYPVFEELMSGSRSLTEAVGHSFAGKLDDADRRAVVNGAGRAIARTARLLEALVDRFGDEQPDGSWVVPLRLRNNELAQLVGVSLASIERSLRTLRSTRALGTARHRVLVLDRGRLHSHAGHSDGLPVI